jgi:FtsP/CotA-like multicopper oxidase with cupredoxin domain
VSRSLLILAVTVLVVAASYYGFSRYAANSQAPANGANALSPPSGHATKNEPNLAPAPAAGAASPATSDAAPTSAAPASDAAAPGTFAIVIDKAHPPAPSDVIRVTQGDRVTLSITSDRAGHLEVHGYKQEVNVEPGTPATLSFAAIRSGRFPIDLHATDGAHVEVSALEVMPK